MVTLTVKLPDSLASKLDGLGVGAGAAQERSGSRSNRKTLKVIF
jgi:hypothetical protein